MESVAWIAERKDVFSGLFWLADPLRLAGLYRPAHSLAYALALCLFCLGLMAKPMLVTLPLVLLLLDRWPLRRGRKLVEKLPFVAASLAVSVVTYARPPGGRRNRFARIDSTRHCASKIRSSPTPCTSSRCSGPRDLAVFYPYPLGSLAVPARVAGIALARITVLAHPRVSALPYLAIGWLWYLITLLPVIGLVQVGAQAHADRYTYIPMIGLAIALVWGAAEALERWPRIRTALAAAVCLICLALTSLQVRYWRTAFRCTSTRSR